MSPTQRTLDRLRLLCIECQVTEHWNQYSKTRHDLFGFIDVLALCDGHILGIQTTTTDHLPERRKKILTKCRQNAMAFLRSNGRIALWGWGERGTEGEKSIDLKTVSITLDDFAETA